MRGEVLEDVAHEDGVEARLGEVDLVEVPVSDLEPEPLARVVGRERARLDPQRAPPAALGLGHVEADPRAEVEEPARRDVALHLREHAARGLALAGLLLDVVVGRRASNTRADERLVGRKDVELHVAAARAADDVAERGAELPRRRDQALRADVPAHGEVRLQAARAARRASARLARRPARRLP